MAKIQGVYVALFGRPADPTGLAYFKGVTNDGNDLTKIGDLAGTKEYQDRFAGQSNVQIVNSIYLSLFNRPAEATGLNFFVDALNKGTLNINNIAIAILDGAQGTDKTIVDTKIAAADAFTAALDTGPEIVAYDGNAAAAQGRAFLAGVTTTAPSQAAVDAAVAGLNPNVPTVNVNFTATIGESLVGTAANESFSGVIDTAGTINVGDTVNGGAGTDTLNILVATGTALPAGFSSSNVEIVNVTYAGAGNIGAINSTSFAGVQQIWQIDNVAGGSAVQNVTVGAGVTAGFRSTGAAATAQAANATVTAAAGVTSVAVAVDGISTSTVTLAETTANGLSTVSVSGSVAGTAAVAAVMGAGVDGILGTPDDVVVTPAVAATNTLTLASTAADVDNLNLNISSNTTVVITALDDLNAIDASASTGNLTVALGTPDELASAKFGSGNDTVSLITTGLNATTTTVTIDLGAGNDVFTLDAGANANANAINITLGAGNDTLDVNTLTNITSTTAVAADLVTVADFNAAQDVLALGGLGVRDVLNNTELANIKGAASLEAALALAAAATTTTQYSIFNYGTDAYIFRNDATQDFSAGDGLIKLVGFQVEGITSANLIA